MNIFLAIALALAALVLGFVAVVSAIGCHRSTVVVRIMSRVHARLSASDDYTVQALGQKNAVQLVLVNTFDKVLGETFLQKNSAVAKAVMRTESLAELHDTAMGIGLSVVTFAAIAAVMGAATFGLGWAAVAFLL